jgi:carbonic anhydrase/acetyltransferase-like protein (isoleucine patch superfamily)
LLIPRLAACRYAIEGYPVPVFSLGEEKPDMAHADDCYVAETAIVIGKVRIKVGASIWFGAVIRGDNEWIEIGERTNVQDNCTLHTDPGFPLTIGAECTVGHNAILHGCLIGDNTLIGMGAILLNGAKVGRNCVVGAGSLIPENALIPDNSVVVGTPARKIRDASEEVIRFNGRSAEVYFNRWQAYARTLKRL